MLAGVYRIIIKETDFLDSNGKFKVKTLVYNIVTIYKK